MDIDSNCEGKYEGIVKFRRIARRLICGASGERSVGGYWLKELCRNMTDLDIAFVGAVTPDTPDYRNLAFSRAGQMVQENALIGLKHANALPSLILSVRPVPSFPRSRRLWIAAKRVTLREGIRGSLIPGLNITPLKQLFFGVVTSICLLHWARSRAPQSRRVVFSFNLSVPPALFTWIGARMINAKWVPWVNDINVPGETVPATLLTRFDYWLHRKLLPHADGLVVVSDRIVQDFAPGRPYLRVEGGIGGIVRSEAEAADMPTRPSNHRTFTLVAAGSLDEANGITVILDAFAHLAGDEYRLLIAGCGPLEELVRDSAQRDNRIQYLGFLPISEVLKVYQRGDALLNIRLTQKINTAYFFPSKVMEYLASGTPVITTCTGHIEAEFSHFCYLLRDENPAALAGLIKQVASIDPDERRATGIRARKYMIENKTWDAQAKRILDFLRLVSCESEGSQPNVP